MPLNSRATLTIPFPAQPAPIDCDINYSVVGGRTVTGIMRVWEPGDSSRCQLCPAGRCSARGRPYCMVQVQERVEPAAAPLYSLTGHAWVGNADRAEWHLNRL